VSSVSDSDFGNKSQAEEMVQKREEKQEEEQPPKGSAQTTGDKTASKTKQAETSRATRMKPATSPRPASTSRPLPTTSSSHPLSSSKKSSARVNPSASTSTSTSPRKANAKTTKGSESKKSSAVDVKKSNASVQAKLSGRTKPTSIHDAGAASTRGSEDKNSVAPVEASLKTDADAAQPPSRTEADTSVTNQQPLTSQQTPSDAKPNAARKDSMDELLDFKIDELSTMPSSTAATEPAAIASPAHIESASDKKKDDEPSTSSAATLAGTTSRHAASESHNTGTRQHDDELNLHDDPPSLSLGVTELDDDKESTTKPAPVSVSPSKPLMLTTVAQPIHIPPSTTDSIKRTNSKQHDTHVTETGKGMTNGNDVDDALELDMKELEDL